jgi:hypothetical protein
VISIYKSKSDIPQDKELVLLNDVFFNKITADKIDDGANSIIYEIDGATRVGKYLIKSKFNGVTLDIDKLSTGCKTVLNVLYNIDKVFSMSECGDNALDILYSMEKGNVYCSFPTISFSMDNVKAISDGKEQIISDYETLKEWWNHE